MSKSHASTHDDARAGFFDGKLARERPERRQFFWCKGIEKAHQRNPHLPPSSVLGLDVVGLAPPLLFSRARGRSGGFAAFSEGPQGRGLQAYQSAGAVHRAEETVF
jgi:hypothetical protein